MGGLGGLRKGGWVLQQWLQGACHFDPFACTRESRRRPKCSEHTIISSASKVVVNAAQAHEGDAVDALVLTHQIQAFNHTFLGLLPHFLNLTNLPPLPMSFLNNNNPISTHNAPFPTLFFGLVHPPELSPTNGPVSLLLLANIPPRCKRTQQPVLTASCPCGEDVGANFLASDVFLVVSEFAVLRPSLRSLDFDFAGCLDFGLCCTAEELLHRFVI